MVQMPEHKRLTEESVATPREVALLRRSIDEMNVELLRLLERRGALALRIIQLKRGRGLRSHDPARESAMIAELATHSRGVFDDAEIATMFCSIFDASRALAARLFSARGAAS